MSLQKKKIISEIHWSQHDFSFAYTDVKFWADKRRRAKRDKLSTTKTAHKHCWPWSCPILTSFSQIFTGPYVKSVQKINTDSYDHVCLWNWNTDYILKLFFPMSLILEVYTANQGRHIVSGDFWALTTAKSQNALFILTSLFSKPAELREDMLGRVPLLLRKFCFTTASWFPNSSYL